MSDSSEALKALAECARSTLGADASASLSPYMFDRQRRTLVAVDAIVTGTMGADPIVVSIETRVDHRIADVSWIDIMRAKHRRLPTTVLLLVSEVGFSDEARRLAEHHGIATLSMADVHPADLAALLGPRSVLWPRTISVRAERVCLRIAANALLEAEVVPVSANQALHVEGSAPTGRVRELVAPFLQSMPARDRLLAAIEDGRQRFELEWSAPNAADGQPLFLRTHRPKLARRVESIRISGSCEIGMGQFRGPHEASRAVSISWPRRRRDLDAARRTARDASRETEPGTARLPDAPFERTLHGG